MKKILSLAVTVLLLIGTIGTLPVSAAASGTCGDNVTWTLDDEGTLTISGTGDTYDYRDKYAIPWYSLRESITEVVITDGVTSVGAGAFQECTGLTRITIPDSVTSIGYSAFYGCISLTGVVIPSNVTGIGWAAFSNCSGLTSITIPDSVTDIGDSAFRNTGYYNNSENWSDGALYINHHLIKVIESVQAYTIKAGIKTIAGGAFADCKSLTEVTIPDSVTSIHSCVFGYYNSKLISIKVDENNAAYCSVDGNLFTKDKTTIVCYAQGKTDTSYTIPDGVTTIGDAAFSGCENLTSVTIPDSVTSIGWSAFDSCWRLTGITIPDGVTMIDEDTFLACLSLTNVTIPDSVTSIGDSAFEICECLTSIMIPDSVTLIGDRAFNNCTGLASVTIGSSVTSIGEMAFSYCDSLTSITIPNSVTSIGEHAFYYCKSLTSVTILDSATNIGKEAFTCCTGLTSVILGNGVTSIGYWAFEGCSSLTSVTIPDSVTFIGDYAFNDCAGLTDITLADSVTYIGGSAFADTGYYNDSDNWEDGVLYINHHLIEANDSVNSVYAIKEGTKTIAGAAFQRCAALTSVIIPNGVTSIGGYAFYRCTGLTSITIPDSVTSIGYSAFEDCSSLTDVYYTGSKTEWKLIDISLYNNELYYATIHFDPTTKTRYKIAAKGEKLFFTSAESLPEAAQQKDVKIILACYKNHMLVDMQSADNDDDEIYFVVNKDFDEAKVMVWKSLASMKPLCSVEIVDLS